MSTLTGSELKRQREELKIPIEQVASETRIRLAILQDLEDEEYSELSSTAQTKGFLSLYAKYLENMREKLGMSNALHEEETIDDNKNSDFENKKDIKEKTKLASEKQIGAEPKIQISADTSTERAEEPLTQSSSEKQDSESQKILVQLGRELAARRRYLNLPWEIITRQTRLKKDTIRALENGELGFFSTPLDFRKDLQTYARFLNLDLESILIRFAEALQKRRTELQPRRRKKNSNSKPASPFLLTLRRFFTLDLFFGTLLILGILSFLVWGISNMRQRSSEEPQITETLPGLIDFILTTPTEFIIEETPIAEPEQQEQIPTATPFFIQMAPEEGLKLSLHARQNIWLRVYADDKLAYEGRLVAGDVKSFSAEDSFLLETSNIPCLEIAFQGAALEPIEGSFGKPARFFFDINGVKELPVFEPTPTQEFTPTPTTLATPGAP
jgi:cytoskeletal protein RodZ